MRHQNSSSPETLNSRSYLDNIISAGFDLAWSHVVLRNLRFELQDGVQYDAGYQDYVQGQIQVLRRNGRLHVPRLQETHLKFVFELKSTT